MTQPEALRLADWLLDWLDNNAEPADLEAACVNAAAKLRCLYAENNELLEALKTCVCAMQDYQAGIGITEMFDVGERMGRAAIGKAEGKT